MTTSHLKMEKEQLPEVLYVKKTREWPVSNITLV